LPSTSATGTPNARARSAIRPAVTSALGVNSENPLFSQTKTTGSRHSDDTFRVSMSTPWFDAPSPKKQTATLPSESSFAPNAAPVAIDSPAPTMPLAPRIPLEMSATCIEPPMPRQIPSRLPQISAIIARTSPPLARKCPWPRCVEVA
jgi:hypothetical protein